MGLYSMWPLVVMFINLSMSGRINDWASQYEQLDSIGYLQSSASRGCDNKALQTWDNNNNNNTSDTTSNKSKSIGIIGKYINNNNNRNIELIFANNKNNKKKINLIVSHSDNDGKKIRISINRKIKQIKRRKKRKIYKKLHLCQRKAASVNFLFCCRQL